MDKLKKLVETFTKALKKKDEKIKDLDFKLKNAGKGDAFVFKMPEIKMPESLTIANFPRVQKVKVDDTLSVKIEGEPEIKKVEVVNLKDPQPVPEIQKVEIIGDSSAKWVPTLVLHGVKAIAGMIGKLWQEGLTVRLANDERYKPQAVIIVDEKGRPVRVPSPASQVIMGFGGGGRGSDTLLTGSTIGTGRKAVSAAGIRVQLTGTVTSCRKVIVCALEGNAGLIYLGGSSVSGVAGSQQGILLEPTGSATLDINDVSKLWIDAVTSGDAVTFTYLS